MYTFIHFRHPRPGSCQFLIPSLEIDDTIGIMAHGSQSSNIFKQETPKQPKQYWRFPYMVVPPNGWFTMENPMKMDDYFHMTTSITGKSMPKDELRAHCWQRPLHWTRPSRCGPLFLAQSPANMERK